MVMLHIRWFPLSSGFKGHAGHGNAANTMALNTSCFFSDGLMGKVGTEMLYTVALRFLDTMAFEVSGGWSWSKSDQFKLTMTKPWKTHAGHDETRLDLHKLEHRFLAHPKSKQPDDRNGDVEKPLKFQKI